MKIAPDKIAHILTRLNDQIVDELTNSYKYQSIDDMSPPLAAVLCALEKGESPSMKELAKKIYRDPSTVTDIVEKLTIRGLVTKQRSSIDARMFSVKLTAEGMDTRAKVIRASRKLFVNLYEQTDYNERRELMNLLSKLLKQ